MTSRIRYNNPAPSGALGMSYHYELLSDQRRLTPFRRSIRIVCPGRRVLESGAGSGILSIWAAQSGAARVYAVEKDPAIAAVARANIRACRCGQRIKLILKDIRDVTLADLDENKVDVAIAENLSTWQVTEPQIPIMNHIGRRLLKKDGFVIPSAIFNTFELCESRYIFESLVRLKSHYFQFSGIPGPVVLSKPVVFSEIDLSRTNPVRIDGTAQARVVWGGLLNSLRLTSPLRLPPHISFNTSDSLMPPVVIPLDRAVSVARGDRVQIRVRYAITSEWERVKGAARIIRGPGGRGMIRDPGGGEPERSQDFWS
jgi:type I protein arginine methyltransferase